MAGKKLLITDDEPNIVDVIRVYAELEGFEVYSANNGMDAISLAKEHNFDLIIMDIMMPVLDGVTACREIRKFCSAPVIFLSAKSEEADKISGFENGADDYVTKPFSSRELMLRVKAVISRTVQAGSASPSSDAPPPKREILKYGGLEIDITGHTAFADGVQCTLTPKEYDLLLCLARNKDCALSRSQLLDKVWGFDFFGDDRTVDTHIKMLRSHIGNYADYIVTVRSVGYKFMPQN